MKKWAGIVSHERESLSCSIINKILVTTKYKIFIVESTVFLCDFHREKAWSEWISKSDHGVSQDRDEILRYLRSIAHSTTIQQFEDAVKIMKESTIWKSSLKLQRWQEGKWLPSAKVNISKSMVFSMPVHTK